ncbi:MAG: hypothetical protein Kow0027_18120 [Saprospiraceae bacterium]
MPVTLPVVDAASPPPCNCTVTQGTFTAPLPYFSSNTSAVNFYNYGNPAAASANTGLDLDSYTDLAIFEGLPQGSYQPSVMDANGCVASQNASIGAYQQLFVYLGADVSIPFGDSVLLAPVISPLPAVEEVVWEGVDCPGCFEVVVAPQQSSSFVVTIFDSLGCSATDTIWVEVEKNFDVFVPNAFSPNHDGVNDLFMIYSGPQVVKVRQLQVFDRWGEPVFTYFNFPPNDPTYGWNGTYRGKELDPAVFAWFAIVEFADGSTKVVKGDVVLMRK